jgi:formylglycine-generating enzyme required for sulfatase activity
LNYTNAVLLCNWLSRREGVPEEQLCYDESRGPLPLPRPNHLSLTGYRLPTEAEWEYAARAGAVTTRFFGETTTFADAYCWHAFNSGHAAMSPGRQRPNALGLFEVLGNVREWCDGPFLHYPTNTTQATPLDDGEWNVADINPRYMAIVIPTASGTTQGVRIEVDWSMRGGTFEFTPAQLSLGTRNPSNPRTVNPHAGVRLARTLTP